MLVSSTGGPGGDGDQRRPVHGRPAGRAPDIGGPAVHSLPELARVRAAARGSRRRVAPAWLLGKVFAGYRAGHNLVPGTPYGRITFEEHLARAAVTG